MVASIIAVTNQKGGCGKSTLSMQLAGAFAKEKGKGRVLVVDADSQGTATRWAATAPDDRVFPADVIGLSVAGNKVHQEVRKFVDKYDWIIIDCPPAVESVVPQSALMISDLAIVPIVPSPPDLWAGVGIKELINRISDVNETLKTRLVANMCQPNTTISQKAMEIIDDYGMVLAKSQVCMRTAFRQSAAFGGTVYDLGNEAKQAVEEVKALVKEIKKVLNV